MPLLNVVLGAIVACGRGSFGSVEMWTGVGAISTLQRQGGARWHVYFKEQHS